MSNQNQAYVSSLPWSLCHDCKQEALVDARNIAAFLCESTTTSRTDGTDMTDVSYGNWQEGPNLCFRLMIDKLDIAAGIYEFPTLSHKQDAPHLCKREEW